MGDVFSLMEPHAPQCFSCGTLYRSEKCLRTKARNIGTKLQIVGREAGRDGGTELGTEGRRDGQRTEGHTDVGMDGGTEGLIEGEREGWTERRKVVGRVKGTV